VIAAFDFFTVPTVTFQALYCFFVIEHRRHRILHFNVTRHPSAESVIQQLGARRVEFRAGRRGNAAALSSVEICFLSVEEKLCGRQDRETKQDSSCWEP